MTHRPLSHHPPERRGHRDCLHTHQPIRRRVLLLRQRATHHPRRYTPDCLEGTHCPYHQGVLQQEPGICRHPQRTGSRHCHQRGGTHVREPDQNETGLNNMWPAAPREAPHGEQIRRRLHQDGSGQLPPQEPDVAEVMLQKIQDSEKSAKPLPASPSWHANAPRKPTCTTASCATAATT